MAYNNPFPKKQATETYKYHHGFEPDDNGNFPATVVAKFDYFTAMYYDCKVVDILKFFNLDMYLTNDLLDCYNNRYYQANNSGKYVKVLLAPGISVELHITSIWQACHISEQIDLTFDQFCNTVFPSIRLAFTGTGLEYLRSVNYDVEHRFMMPSYVTDIRGNMVANAPDGTRCKITRLDIAFDFLNYGSNLFDLCVDLCNKHQTEMGRIFTGLNIKKCITTKWTAKTGSEKTLYLGSTNSDKLCRIYDKQLQWLQSKNIAEKYPYKTKDGVLPESWIRIELQLRKDCCDDILFKSAGDFTKMLDWFYYNFAICSEKGRVAEEFEAIFDWQLLGSIIQNANYVSVLPSRDERISSCAMRILKPYATLVSLLGSVPAVTSYLEDIFIHMQRSSDEVDQRRFVSYLRSALDENNLLGSGWKLNQFGYYEFNKGEY